MKRVVFDKPSEKQKLFFLSRKKYVGFGGARGGGKSWAVRTKAKALAIFYPGIRILIVRRTYPELYKNHIKTLRKETQGVAKYNDKNKELNFKKGSSITFMYCMRDSDTDFLQGTEFDIIFFDEATQLSEYQISVILATMRGANDFPKRAYFTANPGGQGHAFFKRIFVDRQYMPGEDQDEYEFIQSLVTDNTVLMEKDPEYVKQLDNLPEKKKKAWRYGMWDVYEGQFFEEFKNDPSHYKDFRFTHVIDPFIVPRNWTITRSFDWGYSKPFSCGWWATDTDGRIYRIMELYGCTREPNTGLKWTPEQVFAEIHRIETEHELLRGREIHGVADPAIWDAERGISIAETAAKYRVFFTKGDNSRIPGWMQIHYRLQFDENGIPMMYVFSNCKQFIRTIPTLQYSETKVEDLDTDGEDHIADETRYFCMSRPIKGKIDMPKDTYAENPLNIFLDIPRENLQIGAPEPKIKIYQSKGD